MKKILIAVAGLLLTLRTGAQENKGKWWEDIKQNTRFGGYVVGKAAFNDQDLDSKNESHSSFDLRYARAYVDGKIRDFSYKLQVELCGVAGGNDEKGARVLDAWAEWKRYDFLSVRFGQFKRGFTFENPMNPWDIGFGSYSQAVSRLAGMSDRVGEHSSNGRDMGIQVQGDLFNSRKDGHSFLHYQIGAFNGQGINHADRNDTKDIIGGLWVAPVRNLCVGAFGWAGNYSKNMNGRKITVDRNRMAFGVKYESRWSVRGEYIMSQGHKTADYAVSDNGDVSVKGRDKADGWYAMVGVPVTSRCKIYGKWDVYRDCKNKDTQKSIYGMSVNYYFHKNLKLQGIYGFIEDNGYTGDRHYNTGEVQLYWRF